ncbi:MAG TPA: PhnD/SsuA/transferrin family substrate-binding protein [Kofleriaceae bacterium]|jgi:ABC-type amino acid transport substrate-binding protein|nr:PhnD/SsuA/transferrin family substrate-binding protein [Kofleriaceae bacterium]
MKIALIVVGLIAALVAGPGRAAAQAGDVTVGLFAPTAPFEGSGDRVSFVNAVADHLAGAAGGAKVTGKVFSSAGAFAAAVKKGEIQFAIVDAPYAAANGLPYKILAAAVRGGGSSAPWQLIVKSSIGGIRDLRGAKVAVPSTGSREQAFVTNALLGGEVDAGYFAAIIEAPDARSAVTMVSVGKADAAFVPAGVEPPSSAKRLLNVGNVGWPMFVALPSADAARTAAFTARIKTFAGSGAFTGFGGDPSSYRGLAGSFGKAVKKGPMALPAPARLSVRELLEGRSFSIPLSDVLDLVEAPAPAAPAGK